MGGKSASISPVATTVNFSNGLLTTCFMSLKLFEAAFFRLPETGCRCGFCWSESGVFRPCLAPLLSLESDERTLRCGGALSARTVSVIESEPLSPWFSTDLRSKGESLR